MDDLKHIIKLLEDQGKTIASIKDILESQQNRSVDQSKIDKSITLKSDEKQIKLEVIDKNKPKHPINNLYKNHFFETAKSLGEVSKKLEDDGFHFKKGSVQYALDSAPYLERKIVEGNYHWIQKYPPD